MNFLELYFEEITAVRTQTCHRAYEIEQGCQASHVLAHTRVNSTAAMCIRCFIKHERPELIMLCSQAVRGFIYVIKR